MYNEMIVLSNFTLALFHLCLLMLFDFLKSVANCRKYWNGKNKTSGKTLVKYMLLAGWEVRIDKNCDRGLEKHFQARGHSFSLYGLTLSRTITCLSFFLR